MSSSKSKSISKSRRSKSPSTLKKFMENYKIEQSYVNNKDGEAIYDAVSHLGLHSFPIKIKDCETWQNDRDTLVIQINMNDIETAVQLAVEMKSLKADEIDTMICGKKRFMRFWWD
jgi:hypothetical protein